MEREQLDNMPEGKYPVFRVLQGARSMPFGRDKSPYYLERGGAGHPETVRYFREVGLRIFRSW